MKDQGVKMQKNVFISCSLTLRWKNGCAWICKVDAAILSHSSFGNLVPLRYIRQALVGIL